MTIEAARQWVLSFTRWYNTEHKHSGLKLTTPQQRHTGDTTAILEHRQQVYREARTRHPDQWSGEIRIRVLPEKELSELNQVALVAATIMLTNTYSQLIQILKFCDNRHVYLSQA